MKKKITLGIALALLLVAVVYQGTVANFNKTGNVNTQISAAKLGIQLVSNGENGQLEIAKDTYQFENAMPGATIDRQIKVNNTKDREVYVRVIVTRFWNDENGNKLPDGHAEFIKIISSQLQDWIIIDNSENSNGEEVVFYYKKILQPNTTTSAFLDSIKLDEEELKDSTYSKYHASIKVEANAIQKVGAKDAMLSEWGIDVEFDNTGNITNVVE